MYKGPKKDKRVNLWLHSEHYDVITNLKAFYGSSYYCEHCEKPYDHIEYHRCPKSCYVCRREACEKNGPIRCVECHRLCQSESCFRAHKAKNGKEKKSLCDKVSINFYYYY